MAEYLEKAKIKQYIKDFCKGLISDDRQFDPVDDAILLCQMIDFAPAADVVEVVRCKDCKHWIGRTVNILAGHCFYRNVGASEIDFCRYGERRKNGK